jgi:hypothetical protein
LGVTRATRGNAEAMRFSLLILLAGLAVAFLVFVASGGHVLFLPLLLLFPLGFMFRRRRY